MAKLYQLKFAMGTSIFIAGFIFSIFIVSLAFFLQAYFADFSMLTTLIFAVSGITIFILFQYILGPVIVSYTTNLQFIKPGQSPWLEDTVKELAEKSNLHMPKLAIVPNKTPNAFTFGRSSSTAVLAVHEGLLRALNKDEVRAVIAHELGHIKHKDYIVMTVLSALPLIAYYLSQMALNAAWFSGRSTRRSRDEGNAGGVLLLIGIISFIVYIISNLAVMRLSRLREHYADSFSAYLTQNPHGLQSALAKISYGLSILPSSKSAARSFYIEDPQAAKQEVERIMKQKNQYDLDNDGVLDERELQHAMEKEAKSTWVQMNNLFATHPPTFKRIQLLREIENEMKSGQYNTNSIYAHI
ncbi:MAG: M48 family metalloprotease [Crenarchaeota archaeon]|nr:M48 family metalloprotease [Thermoproteota archaeon]